ncbi:uncharacterized protein LOC105433541 [Pogonomyrmex barbatus]|uniref:Uncharacterized protein LOC105433541 n=1 Tax=Pogonomyrmex barbatus TaxID=144034 RepID=A0A6I9WWW8_9HYME|nr:uncharacterized protein LOC105433541 [Pogonomyrmex barbatus]
MNIGPYLSRPDSEDCKCDVHGLKVKKVRYKQLVDKKCRLPDDDLIKVNHERTNLTSFMLDNDCDVEEIMKSVYQTDYKKKGWLVTRYKLLMAAMDSPIGLSIMPTIDLKDAYKDLTRFRYLTIENLKTQPFKTINILNDKQGKHK